MTPCLPANTCSACWARDERREVQARIVVDAGFAASVAEWEDRLSPWLAQVEPVAPSPHVWPRIRTRLGWPSVQGARPSLWNNVGFWRAATGLAIAAGLAVFAIGLRPQAPVALPPPGGDATAGRRGAGRQAGRRARA